VVSSIGNLYRDFEVSLKIEEFDVYENAKDLVLMFTEKDVREDSKYQRLGIGEISRFPSLFSRDIEEWTLEEVRVSKMKDKV
jgi:hypothetical protein